MLTRDFRSYFTSKSKKKKNSHVSFPDLFRAKGNVAAADASIVAAVLESYNRKIGRQGSPYSTNILIYLLV